MFRHGMQTIRMKPDPELGLEEVEVIVERGCTVRQVLETAYGKGGRDLADKGIVCKDQNGTELKVGHHVAGVKMLEVTTTVMRTDGSAWAVPAGDAEEAPRGRTRWERPARTVNLEVLGWMLVIAVVPVLIFSNIFAGFDVAFVLMAIVFFAALFILLYDALTTT